MLDIHWSSERNDYCIKYSHMRVYGSWNYVSTAFYILPLENRTYELTIALHPVMNMVSNFTIGKCCYSSGTLGCGKEQQHLPHIGFCVIIIIFPFSQYEQYTLVIKMSEGRLVTMIYGLLPAFFFLIEDKLFLVTTLHKIFQ